MLKKNTNKDNKGVDKLAYHKRGKINPNCPPFVPKVSLSHTELSSSADLKKSMKAENGQNEDSYSLMQN